MTKRILAVLVVLLLAGTVGLVAGCGGNLPKNAVAKVGNVVIAQKEFDQRVADFAAQYAGQIPDKATDPTNYKLFQQDVLEYMITYQLATLKAQQLKITVTDAEVQTQIDSIKTSSFGGDQAKFDAALKQQGITLDQLKQSYKESMLLQKVYDEVTKSVTTIPDADIQTYYNAHKSDFFVDETRTARHILIAPAAGRVDGTTSTTSTSSTTSTTAASTTGSSGSSSTSASDSSSSTSNTSTASSDTTTTAAPTQADWDAALTTAQKVRADLVAGADWTVEAKTYSDDPGSNQKGGDLGVISKGEMVQEFETAVFSLKLNEISQPVKTTYGYHIIQVTGITPAKQSTLAEVKDQITTTLLSSKKSDTWQSWIEQQKTTVGVIYRDDWKPAATTTTTAAASTSTSAGSETTTTATGSETTTTAAGGASTTTAAPASTTTTAGSSITTAAPAATTSSS